MKKLLFLLSILIIGCNSNPPLNTIVLKEKDELPKGMARYSYFTSLKQPLDTQQFIEADTCYNVGDKVKL